MLTVLNQELIDKSFLLVESLGKVKKRVGVSLKQSTSPFKRASSVGVKEKAKCDEDCWEKGFLSTKKVVDTFQRVSSLSSVQMILDKAKERATSQNVFLIF